MSSPPSGDTTARLEPVVSEAVARIGYDLEEFTVQQAGRRRMVKVVVDADEGVGTDAISDISHSVSQVLDEYEHVLAGSYTLEVTSPGVDRPLTRARHWRRARFRLVNITFSNGKVKLARVGQADDEGVLVLADGQPHRVTYREIERAVVELEFQQPPAEELAKLERAAGGVSEHGDDREDTEESR